MTFSAILKIHGIALASLGLCVMPLLAQSPTPEDTNDSDPVAAPVPVPPVPAKFNHPGLLNDLEELQLIKKKIEAGEEPWKSAFESMKATKWASLEHKPHPHENTSAGIFGAGGGPGGVYDEDDDSIAAYTHTLMWIFTGDERHAQKAVEILNAWSAVLKEHGGIIWYLQTSWEGNMFAQSAELLRSTYPKWKKEDIARFSEMLNKVFLPILHNRMAYGNREFSVINALMAIGVFNNDRGAFLEGMSHWVSYVPNWIYLKEDGPVPLKPNYWLTSPSNEELAKMDADLFPDPAKAWFNVEVKNLGDDRSGFVKVGSTSQSIDGKPNYKRESTWNKASEEAFVDGLCAETFRDLGHCELGFSVLINAAEIAWHQGIDLYSIHSKRITAFMELQSLLRIGDPIPKVFYRVQPTGISAAFEIAYNHYHHRMGIDLPNTRMLIEQAIRPCLQKTPIIANGWSYVMPDPGIRASQICYPAGIVFAWETLTHAELGVAKTSR